MPSRREPLDLLSNGGHDLRGEEPSLDDEKIYVGPGHRRGLRLDDVEEGEGRVSARVKLTLNLEKGARVWRDQSVLVAGLPDRSGFTLQPEGRSVPPFGVDLNNLEHGLLVGDQVDRALDRGRGARFQAEELLLGNEVKVRVPDRDAVGVLRLSGCCRCPACGTSDW